MTSGVAPCYAPGMSTLHLNRFVEQILAGGLLDADQGNALAQLPAHNLPELFAAASRVRRHFFGDRVSLCSIINAKSGLCPEDCSFCAQSAHHAAAAPVYPLLDESVVLDGARAATDAGSSCFGIVTSGTAVGDGEELERLCSMVRQVAAERGCAPGASLGILGRQALQALKDAGLVTYHHNLETARSFFPQICSTHAYEDDVATVRRAREVGLRVCSGGLFGLGENMAQRVELALTLRELQVDSVPINFLDPVPGTPLAALRQLNPLDCLHIIALYRMLLPSCAITVCGGRQANLRELQSMIFLAGANGVMTGNYLTRVGRRPEDDRRLISDLGLTIAEECCR